MKAAAQKLQKQIQKQPSPPREAKEQPKEPSPPRKKPIKVTLEAAKQPSPPREERPAIVLQPGPQGILDRARQKLTGESKRSSSSSQGLRPEDFEEL